MTNMKVCCFICTNKWLTSFRIGSNKCLAEAPCSYLLRMIQWNIWFLNHPACTRLLWASISAYSVNVWAIDERCECFHCHSFPTTTGDHFSSWRIIDLHASLYMSSWDGICKHPTVHLKWRLSILSGICVEWDIVQQLPLNTRLL